MALQMSICTRCRYLFLCHKVHTGVHRVTSLSGIGFTWHNVGASAKPQSQYCPTDRLTLQHSPSPSLLHTRYKRVLRHWRKHVEAPPSSQPCSCPSCHSLRQKQCKFSFCRYQVFPDGKSFLFEVIQLIFPPGCLAAPGSPGSPGCMLLQSV